MIISALPILIAITAQPSLVERAAATTAEGWIYGEFCLGGHDIAYVRALDAGRHAFPLYDKLLSPMGEADDHAIDRILTMLERIKGGPSHYVPAVRRLALEGSPEVKSTAIRFLARHGDKTDTKLALTFLAVSGPSGTEACLDLLAKHGGREEVQLIRAIVGYPQAAWSLETLDYAKDRLAEMEKRLAAEAAKAAAKP